MLKDNYILEDYVSYELAKKLKECGFAEPCNFYYTKEDAPDGAVWFTGDPRDPQDYNHLQDDCPFAKPICSAPHIYHAQKWLREVKRCDVTVYAQPYNGLPFYTGYILFEGDETEVLDDNRQWFDDYEKALSETIAAALELIKKGE